MARDGMGAGVLRLPSCVRRHLTWLAVGLVVLNTLATLILPVMTPSRHGDVGGDFGKIVICTANGLVERSVDEEGTPSDGCEYAGLCLNCLPLLGAVLAAPGTVLWAKLGAATPLLPVGSPIPQHSLILSPTARGPPSF